MNVHPEQPIVYSWHLGQKVGGIILQKTDGNLAPLYAVALSENLPQSIKSEPTGGGGTRRHRRFLVVDFNRPTARVYLGSYNFSASVDMKNGEKLLIIHDRRIAVSCMVEALSVLDHYHFRVTQQQAKKKKKSSNSRFSSQSRRKALVGLLLYYGSKDSRPYRVCRGLSATSSSDCMPILDAVARPHFPFSTIFQLRIGQNFISAASSGC